MGIPSESASNAIIYLTYGVFLVSGCVIAWNLRRQTKTQYLSSNQTQKGIPLALNFIASGECHLAVSVSVMGDGSTLAAFLKALGSGILFSYPEIATIAGVQGLIVYSLSSSLPLLIFGWLGPILRRKCPEGFVLTEWVRRRYGLVAALYISLMTLITLFLYMVSELSALQQIINTLTGLNGLPAVLVECAVTTIYTSLGGFKVSFITDNIQGAMVVGLIILGCITVGVETKIDTSLIEKSGFLNSSLLGWQLLYIFPVAILTNDFFISGFWLRTFASKSDKDLWIGVIIATIAVTCILTLVGSAGLLATWSGAYKPESQEGYLSFFLLLGQLPAWVVGIVLVMVVSLSTAAFDSLQSAMVSTGSNDLFRNKLNLWWIRASVVIIIAPVVVLALRSPDILQIYLVSDLVSAAVIPVLVFGLWDKAYWWRGFEVVAGGLGGILSVFIFGTIYYGNATDGGNLILLEEGLYVQDWSAFGAFVAAPCGAVLFAVGAFALRISVQWLIAKSRGDRFAAFDKPPAALSQQNGDLDNEDAEGNFKLKSSAYGNFF